MRAPERAADGLLPAGQPRPRRRAARRARPAAGRERERGAVLDRGRRRARRGRLRQRRGGEGGGGCRRRAAVRRSPRPGPARPADRAGRGGSRRSSSPAPATASASPGGRCSGSSASSRARRACPARAARRSSSRCRSSRPPRCRTLPEHTPWERMLADYRTTNLSVGPHPLELLRPLLPGEVISTAELAASATVSGIAIAGLAVARQRPVDRKRRRLHAARGRGRARQPRRPAAGLRALPARSSAASRCCSRAAGSSGSAAT